MSVLILLKLVLVVERRDIPTATRPEFLSESVVIGDLFADSQLTVLPRDLRTGCCTTVPVIFLGVLWEVKNW
jgi:hypothetical protein